METENYIGRKYTRTICRSVRFQMRGANQRDQQPRHSIGVTTIQSVASVVAEEEEGAGRE